MIYKIKLPGDLVGFSDGAYDAGEQVTAVTSRFVTDRDGEYFYYLLENSKRDFLMPALEKGLHISQIDRFLVLTKEKVATVYINTFDYILEMIPKNSIEAGQLVTDEDVIGVNKLTFKDIEVSDDMGIAFFFSQSWRRGLFFDFQPNCGGKLENIHYTLGRHYDEMTYYDWYHLDNDIRDALLKLGWFPFLSLIGNSELNFLIRRLDEGKSTDKVEGRLIASFGEDKLKLIETRVSQNTHLASQIPFFTAAIAHYLKGEYMASISILWTRIEGIIQDNYRKSNSSENVKPLLHNLEATFKNGNFAYPGIFLPDSFTKYLDTRHFRKFDLGNGNRELSRHSHAHGASVAADYDQKRALLGILMFDQLSYYINASHKPTV